MKNVLILFLLAVLFSSCSALKNAFQPAASDKSAVVASSNSPFIDDISIKPDAEPATTKSAKANSNSFKVKEVSNVSSPLETYSITQFKYAIHLNVPVETLTNTMLYNLIDEWWRTPYRMGGTTKKGIDCSAFVQTLMMGVFAVQLPRTAREQRNYSSWIPVSDLHEGDLVFFNTRGGVSHVGVYLHNNKFVHASTSSGVMISDLHDTYWSRKFIGAGRILTGVLPKP